MADKGTEAKPGSVKLSDEEIAQIERSEGVTLIELGSSRGANQMLGVHDDGEYAGPITAPGKYFTRETLIVAIRKCV